MSPSPKSPLNLVVREKGLEPLHLSAVEPKSTASANSATRALMMRIAEVGRKHQGPGV